MQQYNIYIIGMYDRRITGFYTYRQELSQSLKEQPNLSVNIVNLRCPISEFQIVENEGITIYNCPVTPQNPLEVNGGLLSLYIKDLENNVFLVNFSPSTSTVRMLRAYFGRGRILYVIHDFMWASFLCGDIRRLKIILKEQGEDHLNQLVCQTYADGLTTFELSDGIVCLSEDTYQLLLDIYGVSRQKIALIPNGLKDVFGYSGYLGRNSVSHSWLGNSKILLYVGRISEQKGLCALLGGFGKVLKTFPNCKLVLIGEVDGKIIGSIDDNIRSNVIFLGIQPKERVYEWYRLADIGILPSYYEQCSYTGIEMKMFGLLVISSDGFGIRRMFTRDNAIVAAIGDRDNPQEFQRNLIASITEALMCAAERQNELRRQSRLDYLNRYTTNTLSIGYRRLFEKLYGVKN